MNRSIWVQRIVIEDWNEGFLLIILCGNSGGEDWLDQQYKEKRRCRFICIGVTILVSILVAAAVVVVLYFTGRIHF